MINHLDTLKIQKINIKDITYSENNIYLLADANGIAEQEITTLAKKFLSDNEQTTLCSRRSMQAKKEFIVSRLLFKTYVAKKLALKYHQLEIKFDDVTMELQAWLKEKWLPLKLSLSHTNGLVFLAICYENKESIGVDIEYHHPKRDTLALATEFFHKNEVEQLKYQHKHYFFILWTLKEAITKMRKGAVVELLKEDILAIAKQYHVAVTSNTDYTLAVAATNKLTNHTVYQVQLWDLQLTYHE